MQRYDLASRAGSSMWKVGSRDGYAGLERRVPEGVQIAADSAMAIPTGANVPVTMVEALWVGQESRHGGNGYRKPTQAEAEAAVLLAVPLVQWFASGALARRP